MCSRPNCLPKECHHIGMGCRSDNRLRIIQGSMHEVEVKVDVGGWDTVIGNCSLYLTFHGSLLHTMQ